MSSIKNLAVTVVGIVLVAVAASMVGQGPAGAAPPPSGPVPVIVGNTPANPVPTRDVDARARQVFTNIVEMDVFGGTNSTQNAFLTVPAGKRAVVEFVSCWMRAPSGASAMAAILLPDHLLAFPMVRVFADPFLTGLDQLVGTQQMTLYLDAGALSSSRTYVMRLELSNTIASAVAGSCSVSGYLTDGTTP